MHSCVYASVQCHYKRNKKDSVENVRKPRCPFARIFLSVLATSLMGRNLAMLQVSVCIRLDERMCNQQGITDLVRLQVTVTHGCCTVFYDAFEHYAPPYGYYIIFHRHGKSKFSLKVLGSTFLKIKGIVCGFPLKAVDSILKTTKGILFAVKRITTEAFWLKLNFP